MLLSIRYEENNENRLQQVFEYAVYGNTIITAECLKQV